MRFAAHHIRLAACALCFAALLTPVMALAVAQPTPSGLPVPRFVTLEFDEVNGRAGPSRDHPVLWVYRRRGLPVQIVAETENWRRVRDPKGDLSWMHKRTLSGARAVVATAETPLREDARPDEEIVAIAEAGAVLSLDRCLAGWCRLESGDHEGWAEARTLWGVGEDER